MIRKVNPNWNWSGHLEGELNFHFGDKRNDTAEDKIAERREGEKKNWQLLGLIRLFHLI